MIPQWQQGIIKKIEQVTHNTRRFIIELPETPVFDFKPGQFVTLDLPIHEHRNKRWRSYSIASMPNGGNVIELLIVLLQGGAGSEYLFNEMKEGSALTLRGPSGVFTLPAVLDKPFFMICTGTGVAPFRSMLHYIRDHNISHQGIHLIFGTRTKEDLLYHQELKELEQQLQGFHYHVALSREEHEGYKGYVHAKYEALCKEHPSAIFMLCGWRDMVDEARDRIEQMGYDRKEIHLELYG